MTRHLQNCGRHVPVRNRVALSNRPFEMKHPPFLLHVLPIPRGHQTREGELDFGSWQVPKVGRDRSNRPGKQ